MKKVKFDTLTGAELKTLLEQKTPDGKLDTLPELMDFLGVIPDEMTLEEYLTQTASAVASETATTVLADYQTKVLSRLIEGLEADNVEGALEELRHLFYTKTEADTQLAEKQPVIEDLETIRSQAATAYQKPGDGIPSTDMTAAVQASLDKADTAYQKPVSGIPNSDMAPAVQESLGKADAAAPQETTYTKAETDAMLAQKQGNLTFDQTPTAGSQNPVTSGGVKDALDTKQPVIEDLGTIRTRAATAYQKPVSGIPSSDLTAAIQETLAAADTALQPEDLDTLNAKVAALEDLIGEDPDGVIDKFNEIVDFLSGISDIQTLEGIIRGLSEAIAAKYAKPGSGIPLADLTTSIQLSLEKADSALQCEDAEDPEDAELVDEYQRLLSVLYQALIDAQTVIDDTLRAKRETETATADIENAKGIALAAAQDAIRAADTANTAALNANTAMNAAKGDYNSLAARLTAMDNELGTAESDIDNLETAVADLGTAVTSLGTGKQDVIEDLDTIRSGAAAGATAYQKPGSGIPATDLTEAVQTSLGKADTAAPQETTYTKTETDTLLAAKQPNIADLGEIRSGAAAGATAYQKPGSGIPATDMTDAVQGLLTSAGTALQCEDSINPMSLFDDDSSSD